MIKLKQKQRTIASCAYISILLATHAFSVIEAGNADRCLQASGAYSCPNCGGKEVSDCLDCAGFHNTDTKYGMCFKRKLYNNYDTSGNPNEQYHYLLNDIFGAIVWFFAAGIATACGVGGGGIYVPLGIILLRFAPKPSSGLSQASIFGASLGGLILNIRNKHPNTKIRADGGRHESGSEDNEYIRSGGKFYSRPRIDYDMALFLAPMEMAGAVLGVLIQKVLPNWLYLMLSAVILGFTSYKTFLKFLSAYKIEKEKRSTKKLEEMATTFTSPAQAQGSPKASLPASNPASPEHSAQDATPIVTDGEITEAERGPTTFEFKELKQEEGQQSGETAKDIEKKLAFLELDSRQYPREKLVSFVVLWIGLFILTFLKGGKGVESVLGIYCDSPWYFVLIASQFIWTLGFAMVFGLKLVRMQEERNLVNYPYLPKDVRWDSKKLRFYAAFTFGAGIVAGLIGIGGGMVLGPLMLVMGINPIVSSATTATMIVLTSSSVAVLFIISGLVPLDYAIFFFCVCLSGAYVGKRFIDGYVRKSGMTSILIFILASIIGFSTIGCIIIVILQLSEKSWCFDGLQPFCVLHHTSESCGSS